MSRTSQPPRRDLYQIETETAHKAVFLRPKPPRIGTGYNAHRTQIFNADFAPSGERIGHFTNPWNVTGPIVGWETFPTHAEALHYATTKEAT